MSSPTPVEAVAPLPEKGDSVEPAKTSTPSSEVVSGDQANQPLVGADAVSAIDPSKAEREEKLVDIVIKTLQGKELKLQFAPEDNIQDVRHYLSELQDTCFDTCYRLKWKGEKVDDYAELQELPDLEKNNTFVMVEDSYDERTARTHVLRFQTLLDAFTTEPSTSPSFFSHLSSFEDKDGEITAATLSSLKPKLASEKEQSLSSFYPPEPPAGLVIKSLLYSGWNPPPGHRQLCGDLFYLEVCTNENKVFNVTAATNGFFINATNGNQFNPAPTTDKPIRAHSLVELLKAISPYYKKKIPSLLEEYFARHPFESTIPPFPVTPWVGRVKKHVYKYSRALNSYAPNLIFNSNDLEAPYRGQIRDWNEEYQTFKELPKTTIHERIQRDRALVLVNADFVEAATKGAMAIINKTAIPVNPAEPEKVHMYVINNIFFTFARDGRNQYQDIGGDETAYRFANNELKGTIAFNQSETPGLYTVACALIDYKGHRIVAQSIIPGILHRESSSTIMYGTSNDGKTIVADKDFHELMVKAGKNLHYSEHEVKNPDGAVVMIAGSMETKGVVGTDNRKYILDLFKIQPRDLNFPGKENVTRVLRPEFIATYYEYLKRQAKQKADQEKNPEKATKEVTDAEAEKKEEKEAEVKENQEIDDFEFVLSFNPDCYVAENLVENEKLAEDRKLLEDAAKYLSEILIPSLIEDFSTGIYPIDGEILISIMHSRGINIRYLGLIAEKTKEKLVYIHKLCVREMSIRAAKHLFNEVLRETPASLLAEAASDFLNCFIGSKVEEKKGKKKASKYANSAALWTALIKSIQEKFRYTMSIDERKILHSSSTLRAFCLKVGLQVAARDYKYSSEAPFEASDILDMYPKVKHTQPMSVDGVELLEAGKSYLLSGRLDVAFECLTDSLTILHQVYGGLHPHTASCYSNLAMVLYHAGDHAQALSYMEKATIISERVLGLDHYVTIHCYGELALISQNVGKTHPALKFIEHALYLTTLTCGPDHPDNAQIWVNIATLLQELGNIKESIDYLLDALKFNETHLGPNHLQTAATCHSLALAHSMMEQYKEALDYEKRNYHILSQSVGESDLRTVESNIWLKQFTQKGVQYQMERQAHAKAAAPGAVKGAKAKGTAAIPKSVANLLNPTAVNPTQAGAANPNLLYNLNDVMKVLNGPGGVKSFINNVQQQQKQNPPASSTPSTTSSQSTTSTSSSASTSTSPAVSTPNSSNSDTSSPSQTTPQSGNPMTSVKISNQKLRKSKRRK